jgi:thiamine kinase-like enzyme
MQLIDIIFAELKSMSKTGTIQYEPLNGGFTNQTYKVTIDDCSYVVRVNGRQNEYLRLDRALETEAIRKAHQMGIAPNVIMIGNKSDYLITEFIEGQILNERQVKEPAVMEQIVGHLQHIHSMEGIERECTPYHLIESYVAGMREIGAKIPDGFNLLLNRMHDIQKYRSDDKVYSRKFCHNDFFTVNTLFDGQKLTIIDWELSGYGDVFFDLASLPFSVAFTEAEEKTLLSQYFGYYDDEQFRILQDMKFMNMLREVAWALFHARIGAETVNHNFDYYKHAVWVMERIEQGHNSLA